MIKFHRLGIFGGSFNPIHLGHLILADRALEQLDLDHVLIVPSCITPLKDQTTLAPASDRYLMATLAVRGIPHVSVDDIEVKRGGISYSIDTVEALKTRAKELFLIVGSDRVKNIHDWHRVGDLANFVTLAVAKRVDEQSQQVDDRFRSVEIIVPKIDISATEIRRRVLSNLSIRHLVPKTVEKHILATGLYSSSTQSDQ